MKCPHDQTEMDHLTRHGVTLDHCPTCGGIWLDKGEIETLLEAVRPAVALADPDPVREPPPPPPPPPLRPVATELPRPTKARSGWSAPSPKRETSGKTDKPKKDKAKKDKRSKAHDTKGFSSSKRYKGKHSRTSKFADILEDIFDFD